jgi:prepilin-type N-terminal cleavage/methylation domain-containing protein
MSGVGMKILKASSRAKGFSLVEMIIVMAILSIVMMAAMSLFIPAKRASVVQTDLADVQGNLRLALNRMTKDFRTAGFLTTGDAISGYTLSAGDPTVSDPTDSLVINTLTISGCYGRIETPPTNTSAPFQFVLHDALQVDSFNIGNFVAIVQPVEGTVINNKIYKVELKDRTARTLTLENTDGSAVASSEWTAFSGTITGNVILVAPTDVVADINRTITYSHADTDSDGTADALTRQIDAGNTQFLARNVSALQFVVEEDVDGDPHKVTIEINGQTVASGHDIVGSQKTKSMRTVVSLRNI